MIDTTQLTNLISAFRVETEKESISPETVGSLLQNITDLLANASSSTEQQIFENWKAILSQLHLVESVEQGANNVEHVNITMSLRDLANGGRTGANFQIEPATEQRAGVMTAAQAQTLAALNLAVDALKLAAVNLANKNTEQDNRLDIIQGRSDVITDMSQGSDHASKVYLTIRKENLKTGAIYNKINNKEIAAATSEKAGVMTAQQAKDLQKAVNGLLVQEELIRVLHSIDLVVTSIEDRPYRKDCLYYGVEYCDLYAGERFPADDDIMIPGATTEHAGVMTAKQVQRLDDAERDIFNLRKAFVSVSGGATGQLLPIALRIGSGEGPLQVLGALPLIEKGYFPYLFRFSRKRNRITERNEHDEIIRKHGPVRKGWNMVGKVDAIRVANDGTVSIRKNVFKHPMIDTELLDEFQTNAKFFIKEETDSKGTPYVSYGKTQVKLTREVNGQEVRRKVRLLYGIAFADYKVGPRGALDMSRLVTPIVPFHVCNLLLDTDSSVWIFER